MYKNKVIGVVVPAYNEEKLIGRVIETMPEYVDRIVVVDDCSRDGTTQVVRCYQDKCHGRLVLLEHPVNQGVGGAIASGYKWCRDQEIDVAVVMAGDAQMDPADMPALLEPVVTGQVDYAKGNRLITGEAWQKIPRTRYLGNAMLSLLTKIASGYWHVADSQTGYTAISLKALKTIQWDEMFKRYGQPNDLLVRLNVYNFAVRDVPVKPVYNIGETSGIRPIHMIPKLTLFITKLFIWRMVQKYIIRDFHPLIFFYASGLVFMPIGFLFGLNLLIYRFTVGRVEATSALFAAFLFISGWQFLLFAMWFDMEYNKDLK